MAIPINSSALPLIISTQCNRSIRKRSSTLESVFLTFSLQMIVYCQHYTKDSNGISMNVKIIL